jgi:putative transposase
MLRAASRRRLERTALTHQSDRGSQYASHEYRALLAREATVCGLSRSGNCWDNAVVFFGTLKTELPATEWPARAAATAAVTDYIDAF